MEMNEYQALATSTASYPDMGANMIYPALGLVGESGEVADKIKKLWRNKNVKGFADLSTVDRLELIKELGDVLWYCAALATEIKADLGFVALKNIEKLRDRHNRGVIKSEGDNR